LKIYTDNFVHFLLNLDNLRLSASEKWDFLYLISKQDKNMTDQKNLRLTETVKGAG